MSLSTKPAPPTPWAGCRCAPAALAEQREERRLVGDEAAEEVGTLAGQPQRDRRAEEFPTPHAGTSPQVVD
jgi:hypothetical protein